MNHVKKQTMKDRYGNEVSYEFEPQVKPLDQTELIKSMMENGVPEMGMGVPQPQAQGHPGGPRGSDTVPAWLTPGEFVMNAEATKKFGPQIEAMNNEGRAIQAAQGGTIPQYHANGGSVSDVPLGIVPDTPEEYQQFVQNNIATQQAANPQTGSAMIEEFGVGSLPGEGGGVAEVEGTKDTGDLIHDLTGGAITTQDRRAAARAEAEAGVPETQAPPAPEVTPENVEKVAATELDLDKLSQEFKGAGDLKASVDGMFPEAEGEEQNLLQYSSEDLLKAGEEEAGGSEEGQGFLGSVVDMFKKVGGELLDSEELTKQAIMYLGSRALGFSHGGSLRHAAGSYLKGIQGKADAAKAQKAAQAKRQQGLEDFKTKETFKAGLDIKKQQIKDGQIKVDRSKPTLVQGPDGKQKKVFVATDGAGNKTFVDAQNNPVDATKYESDPYKVKGTKEYRQRIGDYRSITAKQLKEAQERIGSFKPEDGETQYTTNILPQAASGEIAKWAVNSGVEPEELGGLVESAYTEAVNYSRASGKKAGDITPFLNQLVIRKSAGANESLFQTGDKDGVPQYVDADKMANINTVIRKQLEAKGSTQKVSDVANQYFNALVPDWNAIGPEAQKKWDDRANKGENGFYVYLANRMGLDERKIK